MSSVCAVSALTLPNNNNNNNNNSSNKSSNESSIECSNDSQTILNNLKLIKNNIKVNGHRDKEVRDSSDECLSCEEVLNKCNNGLNMQNSDTVSNVSNVSNDNNDSNDSNDSNVVVNHFRKRKSSKDETKSSLYSNTNGLEFDDSGPSTMSSSPVTSPMDESNGFINEVLLEERFSKLGLSDLRRADSPIIQINGNDSYDDYDEDDDGLICRAPLLRSTSLKTGKTPPGTPHRKKIVRFADALGLDLESVRHIITDDLPIVPQSAFGALKTHDKSDESMTNSNKIPWFMQKQMKSSSPNRPNLMLEFIQPSSLLNFMDRVRNNKVCLENCIVSNSAGNLSITCVIRVLNVSFEKSVTLRYTSNEWLTYNEALASYIPNSCDGFSDKFTVTFSVSAGGYYLSPGQRMLFALRYTANTEEYWDSNMGLNYSLIYRV